MSAARVEPQPAKAPLLVIDGVSLPLIGGAASLGSELGRQEGEYRQTIHLSVGAGQVAVLVGNRSSGIRGLIEVLSGKRASRSWLPEGDIHLAGRSLAGLSRRQRLKWIASHLAFVPSDPSSLYHPGMTLREHLSVLRLPKVVVGDEGKLRDACYRMGLPEPEHALSARPGDLSADSLQQFLMAVAVLRDLNVLVMEDPCACLTYAERDGLLERIDAFRRNGDGACLLSVPDGDPFAAAADSVTELVGASPAESLVFASADPTGPARRDSVSDWEAAVPAVEALPPDDVEGVEDHEKTGSFATCAEGDSGRTLAVMAKPVVLIIRDGWGINPGGESEAVKNGDATLLAKTPFHEALYGEYPCSQVSGSGLDVGLPEGQMGNSEVGHLNLGAGRIVYQDLTRINKAIEDGTLSGNDVLQEAFSKAKGRRLHLVGLLSDGGVHSHQDHIIALAREASAAGCDDIFVHAITDGRDTSPTGGEGYLSYCEDKLGEIGARIATVIGRYYAMDRDNRWERTKLGWDAIVHGKGEAHQVLTSEAVAAVYAKKEKTDEFLLPMVFAAADEQRVRDGDVVLFCNFRADRARQLSQAFLQDDFEGFDRGAHPKVHYVTLTEYDETYDCPVVFPPENLKEVLGKVVSDAGLKQLRIAETEKYPHVTYFFNGGVEEPFSGEDRVIVPSPKVATYDLQPEMSADEVTEAVVSRLDQYDLVILNFANPDMVGHTGVVEAAVAAVEKIDEGVQQVVERTLDLGGKLLITADHGNCEQMIKPDGSPHTAHTTNLVHLIYVAEDAGAFELRDGILADIAPTLLAMLETEQPELMTGSSLLEKRA